jgi:hypothetical protein
MSLFTKFPTRQKLVLLAAMLFSMTMLQAQTYQYDDAWGKTGMTLNNQSATGLNINFSIQEFSLVDNMIDGTPMKKIEMSGAFLPNNAGAPDLPGFGRYIAIPQGARAILNVKSYRTETFTDVELAPAPKIPLDTDNGPLVYQKDQKLYSKDAFYPEQPFLLSDQTQLRGVDAAIVGITPFQYNPVTKELIVYRDIEIEVVFEGGNGHFGQDRLRSRWFDPILEDALLNAESLPEVDYNTRYKNHALRDETGFEYLIVIPNDPVWMPFAEQIKEWRTAQGIYTGIMTLADIGTNTASGLENFFNDAYNNWDIPPVAVLLMADYGTNANNSIIAPIWDSYCASDNIYADVNNNDMPDIIFARMTAQNETHLQTMVSKMLDYEANPPTDANFYHKPITALGWQTERWFQICSETVGGYWREVEGKEPVRINAIYSGNPNSDPWSTATNTGTVLGVFGPNGLGYIPATPAELGGWSGGNAQAVINAINDGAFVLQHRDHGGETGWGEPDFQSNDINQLTNTEDNEFPFIFSINCLTGKYNISGECFAEKFHRHTHNGQNAGALGIIAASEVSYSFVNDTYVWGMFDNMNPDFLPDYGQLSPERGFLPAFGNAGGKYFLQQSDWPYNTDNKEVTYNLFHHHGGAFLQVFSEVPQNLAVTHNPILYAGETTFTVLVEEGAYIALTVDGEIIATAVSQGGATNLMIDPQYPPSTMVVTVTKQNYYRYSANVDVIPPEGPYVVGDSYIINDPSGNNNGQMDYGESITLDMTMKNVGVDVAENVTVTMSTTDPYVTITDGTEYFGNIDPDATVTVADAFALDVDANIPNNHSVSFLLQSTNGTDVWDSYITIKGYAPVLQYIEYTIDDSNGNNNGQLDPGETAIMTVVVENDGGADAYNVEASLTSSDPYVSVLTSEPQVVGDLAGGATGEASFTVSASEAIPAGYVAELTVAFEADLGVTQEDVIEILFPDYCYPSANCSYGDGFTGFVFDDIDNSNSGCSNSGYGDYTNMSTEIEPGQTYTIQWETGYSNQQACLWIDFNDDKTFDASERLITDFALSNSGQYYNADFTVPNGITSGAKRMRIRANWQNSSADPCEDFSYGETEDYTVIVAGGPLLPPPENLQAEVVNENDVHVTWDAPSSDAFIGYNVYRNGNIIAEEISELEYMDMDLDPGTYNYQVSAVYDEGMSSLVGPVSVTITGGNPSGAWETFEDYNAGEHLAQQANAMGRDYWTTWDNAPGSATDPYVSNDEAHAGSNSVVIETGNDAVLLLGDKTSGKWNINFYAYIPDGYYGYFNILQEFNGSNSQWGMQAYFDAGGVGTVDAGGQGAGTFNYSYDTWIYINFNIDLDADFAEMYVDGNMVVEWQWSTGTFGTGTLNQLAAMNFYAWDVNGTPKAYFDDIDFGELSNSLIFEPFEEYTANDYLVQQAVSQGIDFWTTWDNAPGSATDPMVSDDVAYEGSNSMVIEGLNDAVMLLGDKTSGKYAFKFYVYIPTGYYGYFNVLQEFNGANSQWGMQAYFDAGGLGTVDAGGQGAGTFSYNYDTWINVNMIIDLNLDWAEMYVDGNMVVEWQWSTGSFGTGTLNQLGAADFYAWDVNGTPKAYFDNIELTEFVALPPPTNLVATVDDNDVTLTWDAPPSDDFIGYNVYRDAEMIAQEITETTYADMDLLPGTYQYDVKAIYDEGYSAGAGPVPATIEGGTDRQMVVLEIGTGTWCQYCPGAAMGADDLVENGHDVAVIEYHGGDDYETTESMYRITNYYGLSGYPTAWFDGVLTVVGGNATQSLYETYLPLYEERAAKISVFELTAVPEYTGGNSFNFTITANNIYPYPGANVVLQAVATESEIPDNWLGLDEVNFVCRKMLPDQMGTALDFGSQSTYEVELPFTWDNDWDIDHMDLVVFLQDNDTKEILQATLVEDLGMYVGIDDLNTVAETSVFPNPASDVVNVITGSNLQKVRIMNNNGQEIFNRQVDGQTLQINTSDYQPGVYFMEIRTTNGVVTKKLVIR